MRHVLAHPPLLASADVGSSSEQSAEDALRNGIQQSVNLARREAEDLGALLHRTFAGPEAHQDQEVHSLLLGVHADSVHILALLLEVAALLGQPRPAAAHRRRQTETYGCDAQRLLRVVASEFARTGRSTR